MYYIKYKTDNSTKMYQNENNKPVLKNYIVEGTDICFKM